MEKHRQEPTPEASGLPERLSKPAQRALAGAGIERLEQLTSYNESALSQLHGVGPKAIEQLRQALHARGLRFAPD